MAGLCYHSIVIFILALCTLYIVEGQTGANNVTKLTSPRFVDVAQREVNIWMMMKQCETQMESFSAMEQLIGEHEPFQNLSDAEVTQKQEELQSSSGSNQQFENLSEAEQAELIQKQEELQSSSGSHQQFENLSEAEGIQKQKEYMQMMQESGNQELKEISEHIDMKLMYMCQEYSDLQYGNLSSDKALRLVSMAGSDVNAVNTIIKKGISNDVMEDLVQGKPLNHMFSAIVVAAVTGAYMERKGGARTLTPEAIRQLNPSTVVNFPADVLRQLPKSSLDEVLDVMYNTTIFALSSRQLGGDGMNEPTSYGYFEKWSGHDYRSYKSFCDAAFRHYKTVNDQREFNRILFLLPCAPVKVCQSVDFEMVQTKPVVTKLPWSCMVSSKMEKGKNFKPMSKVFRSHSACGRILSNKALDPRGSDPVLLSNPGSLDRLQNLGSCLEEKHMLVLVYTLNCSTVIEGLQGNFLPEKVAEAGTKRCMTFPEDPASMTCDSIADLGGLVRQLPRSFLKRLSKEAVCEKACIAIFTEVQTKDTGMKGIVAKKCYSTATIDAAAVSEMQGMVAKLPMKKLKEVPPAALVENLDSIKETVQMEMKKDPRRKSVIRNLAIKAKEAGAVREMMDSKDFMKELSIKDLSTSMTADEIVAFGQERPGTVDLPDSQNKWIMEKILETEDPRHMTEHDIREKTTLVKGFLSSTIMALNPNEGMGIAVALCEHTNWPLKSSSAITKGLILPALAKINDTDPMSALTTLDVSSLGCECLMHLSPEEIAATSEEVCTAVCHGIGSCSHFQCTNPLHRRNIFQTCLQCMHKDGAQTQLTDDDFEVLGPVLVQELSASELQSKVSSAVMQNKYSYFRQGCMKMSVRKALGIQLSQALGSASSMDSIVIGELGDLLTLLSDEERNQVNKSILANYLDNINDDLTPEDEEEQELQQCCEMWLPEEDRQNLLDQRRKMYATIKDVVYARIQARQASQRRKRTPVVWTCSDIKLVGQGFTDATVEEIQAIEETEFENCITHLGSLSGWTDAQKTALLAKAEQYIADICHMEAEDVINLGGLSLAMSEAEIQCLLLVDDDLVAALGSLSDWSAGQLTSLANVYKAHKPMSDFTKMTSSDITTLGHILCSFSVAELQQIPTAELSNSGAQIGQLEKCPIDQLTALKTAMTDAGAYGPVSNWTVSQFSELGIVVAGFSAAEIQTISNTSIEGVHTRVIPLIPADILQSLSVEQFLMFSEPQARMVTDTQKAALSAEQQTALVTAAYGDNTEKAIAEFNDESSGTGDTTDTGAGADGLVYFWLLTVLSAVAVHFL